MRWMLSLLLVACVTSPGEIAKAASEGVATDSVKVRPQTVTIQSGETTKLTASVWPKSAGAATWANRDTTKVSMVVVGKSVRITGQNPGTVYIVAVNGTRKDSALVTVGGGAAIVVSLRVTPALDSLTRGQTQAFTATDSLSDASTTASTATWSATGGTITSGGVYTAGATAGTFRVIAVNTQQFADTATVVVATSLVTTGEAAAKADSFVQSIGTNVHYSYTGGVYGNRTLIKSLVQRLGIKHLRDGGKSFNSSGWMTNIYGPMKDLSLTLGVRWQLLADPFGDLAYWSFTDTKGTDSVLKYIGKGDTSVVAWEGLNEWNTKRTSRPNWAAEDSARQHALWTKWNATYTIVGPSFTRYVDACTVGNMSAWAHYGNMHPYPAGRPQTASLQQNIDSLTCVNGSDPLYATETGYQNALSSTSGNRAVDETIAGKYMGRLWFDTFRAGVVRTFSYELIDQGVSSTNAELSFGLYHNDGTAKPSATVTKNIITLVSDTTDAFSPGALTYTITGDQTNLKHVLLAKADGTKILAFWLDVPSIDTDQTRSLTLALGSSKTVTTYRPRNSTSAVTTVTGTSIPLTVRDEIVLVKIAP